MYVFLNTAMGGFGVIIFREFLILGNSKKCCKLFL